MKASRLVLALTLIFASVNASAKLPWPFGYFVDWLFPSSTYGIAANFGMYYCPDQQCLVNQIVESTLQEFITLNNITPNTSLNPPVPRGFVSGDVVTICNGTVCIDMDWEFVGGINGFHPDLKKGLYKDPHTYRNLQHLTQNNNPISRCVGCWVATAPSSRYVFGIGTVWDETAIWDSPLKNGVVYIYPVEIPSPTMPENNYRGDPSLFLINYEPTGVETTGAASWFDGSYLNGPMCVSGELQICPY
jgi:hypothetical protein